MRLSLGLESPPTIIQAGLSLHGYRRKETFVMHDVWGLHLYLYEGTLSAAGAVWSLAHGSISITPPGVPLEWKFPDHAPHYYVHFLPQGGPGREVPWLVESGQPLETLVTTFEFIASVYRQDPPAAQARLWNLLLGLARKQKLEPHDAASLPTTVQVAISEIAQNLNRRIFLSALAKKVGVSHNYLITQFHASFGCTIAAYVRTQRCDRARFLLTRTSLSIKTIAQEVGIPDLNHFNKVIRRVFGCSPTQLRTRQAS